MTNTNVNTVINYGKMKGENKMVDLGRELWMVQSVERANEVVVTFKGQMFTFSKESVIEAINTNEWNTLVADTMVDLQSFRLVKVHVKGETAGFVKTTHNAIIELAYKSMIDTKTSMEAIRSRSLKKNKNFSHYTVVVGKDNENEVRITKSQENRASRLGLYDLEDKMVMIDGKRFVTLTKEDSYPGTKTIMDLDIDDIDRANALLKYGILVDYNEANTRFFFVEGTEAVDIFTGERLAINPDWIHYQGFGFGPSKLRRVQIFLINSGLGEDRINAMLNELTFGAYDIIMGKEVDLKKLIKLTARMFQWTAPSKVVGTIGCYAYFRGEVAGLKADGKAWANAKSIAKMLSKLNGVTISESAAAGAMDQARPFSVVKASFDRVMEKTFVTMLNHLIDQFGVVRFEKVTPQDQMDILNGKYDNMVIIVGKGVPDILFDNTTMKADFDFSSTGTYDVLDIAQASQARMSKQMAEKPFAIDRDATLKMVRGLFNTQVLDEMDSQFMNRKVTVPTIKTIESGYLKNIIGSIAPAYATNKDKSLYRALVDSEAQRLVTVINRFGFEIDGFNGRLSSDFACVFGFEVLEYNEVFSKKASKYFRKLAKQLGVEVEELATLFKYPTMGSKECYPCKVVSLKELKRRIGALDTTVEIKAAILDYYVQLGDATIVVPAIELLKQQLAGMDFDFDGATMILNVEFNAIIHRKGNFAVNIIDDEAEVKVDSDKSDLVALLDLKHVHKYSYEKFIVGLGGFVEAFLRQTMNDNRGIGEITNINAIQIAMQSDLETAKNIFTEIFGTGSETYHGLVSRFEVINGQDIEVVDINKAIITALIAEIGRTNFEDDNSMTKILDDLEIVYRYYQESTIDAAKTGANVPVEVEPGKKAWALSLSKIKLVGKKLDWVNNKMNWDLIRPKNEKLVLINDVMNKVRTRCMKELKALMEERIMTARVEFATEDLAKFEVYATSEHKDMIDSLSSVKFLYNDITADYIARLMDCDDEDYEAVIKADYKEELAVLTSMVRGLTADLTPVERAKMMKYSALRSSNGSRRDGGSQYAAVLCPQEYVLMLIEEGYAEIDFAGYRLIANKGYVEGDIVNFTNGVAEKTILEESIDGLLEIKEFNGELYATKKIEDIIVVPAAEQVVAVRLNSSVAGREEEVAKQLVEANEIVINAHKNNYSIVADGEVVGNIDTRGRAFNRFVDGAVINNVKVLRPDVNTSSNRVMTSVVVIGNVINTMQNATEDYSVEVVDSDISVSDDL